MLAIGDAYISLQIYICICMWHCICMYYNNNCENISLCFTIHYSLFFIIQKLHRMSWQYRKHFSLWWLTQRKEIILLFTFCNFHQHWQHGKSYGVTKSNKWNILYLANMNKNEQGTAALLQFSVFMDGTISEIMIPTEIFPHPKHSAENHEPWFMLMLTI